MSNKGSIYAGILIFYIVMFIFLMFLGITIYHIVITGELHTIKNDLYLINRNVLLALDREQMGEDINSFYEKDVKNMVTEEIKRQWNVDVSQDMGYGIFNKVDVENAKIIKENEKMYIETVLNIKLKPIIFQNILQGKLVFRTKERLRVEKMKGWGYD